MLSNDGPAADPLLELDRVSVRFPVRVGALGRKQMVHAVDDVSLAVGRGETLGLVGESGSGKTTLGYAVLGRFAATTGRVLFDGTDITGLHGERLRLIRRNIQMIFQDPFSSLNPRMRVEDIIAEPLIAFRGEPSREERHARVLELLALCGLPSSAASRYPGQFSGGQRQRIGIARALALRPKLLIADEPTSALDVSVQAQVVNLLSDLQEELGLSYLFISHDLSVVRHVSNRIAIMYLGGVVELAATNRVFAAPKHPYTQALLSAIPVPDQDRRSQRIVLSGDLPSPMNPPSGCRFSTRCPSVTEKCIAGRPPLSEVAPGHYVACWYADGTKTSNPTSRSRSEGVSS